MAVTHIYLLVMVWDVLNAIQTPKIEMLSPKGIIFNITDEEYNLVGVHYSINAPLFGRTAGRWNFDITQKTGNDWIHQNPVADVSSGDTVYYWVHAILNRNGVGVESLNQLYTIPAPTCDNRLYFICNDGRCILKDLRCDGVTNCGDNSDESNCVHASTPTNEITSIITPAVGRTSESKTEHRTFSNTPSEGSITSSNPAQERISSVASSEEITSASIQVEGKTYSSAPTEGGLSKKEVDGIVGAVLGSTFLVCVTIICVVCIRGRNARNRAKDAEVNLQQLTTPKETDTRHDVQSRNISQHIYDYAESKESGYTRTGELQMQFENSNKYESLLREPEPLPGNPKLTYDKLNPPYPYLEIVS